ncbi:terpenoid synthase [Cercophora newfieldiana]|uniref:Terpene synthase n=1 Tax=Cercophora newfieldiana TaxID=92897 RepID=A0AA40CX74_9PEZI|nr:terpenoid synthase [Cercophora newfieldiana]
MAAVNVKIPDFMGQWPYEKQLNTHYETAKAASRDWLHSFGLFEGKPHDAFDRSDFQRLAMLSYLQMNLEQARVGCELMILFYAFDEYTDVENGTGAKRIADLVMDAVEHPEKPRPAGEIPLGELTRQFWSHALPNASPLAQRHFIQTLRDYAYGCVLQAEDRAADRIRSIDDYWKAIYMHPLLVKLRELTMQSVVAINDVLSYNVERLRGHELHNLITVVMHEKMLGLPDAVAWIGTLHESLVAEFITCREEVKNMRQEWGGDVSHQVDRYVDGLGEWARGNYYWHFESERYFGSGGPRVQEEGEVMMLPPAVRNGGGWDEGRDSEALVAREIFAVTEPAGLQITIKSF